MDFLLKPLGYIFIIALGIFLRYIGVFKEGDHRVLSTIVLKITLPAAIVRIYSQVDRDFSLYWILLIGFMAAAVPLFLSAIFTRKMATPERAYTMINMSGYNVGCFALPIIQNYFGAEGAIIACMFDAGNGSVSSAGNYAVTSTLLRTNPDKPVSVKTVVGKLLQSVPFLAFLVMTALNLANLKLPATVLAIVDPMANANAFLSMLMIGAAFKLDAKGGYIKSASKIIALRFCLSAVFAVICVFLTPFDAHIKKILVMLCFSPIASLAIPYTEQCGGDEALAGFTNSLSVIVSLVIIILISSF